MLMRNFLSDPKFKNKRILGKPDLYQDFEKEEEQKAAINNLFSMYSHFGFQKSKENSNWVEITP